jgi:hypothetical protein
VSPFRLISSNLTTTENKREGVIRGRTNYVKKKYNLYSSRHAIRVKKSKKIDGQDFKHERERSTNKI